MNEFIVQGLRKETSCISQPKTHETRALKVQFCMGNFTRQVEIGPKAASKAHEPGCCVVSSLLQQSCKGLDFPTDIRYSSGPYFAPSL